MVWTATCSSAMPGKKARGAENSWFVVCDDSDDLVVSQFHIFLFPGQPGSLESMKNPYESTSVCKVTQLTTEVSLNF